MGCNKVTLCPTVSKVNGVRLTLCRLMDFSIRFDTVKSGWSIVYIEGSQFPPPPFFLNMYYFSFRPMDFSIQLSQDGSLYKLRGHKCFFSFF